MGSGRVRSSLRGVILCGGGCRRAAGLRGSRRGRRRSARASPSVAARQLPLGKRNGTRPAFLRLDALTVHLVVHSSSDAGDHKGRPYIEMAPTGLRAGLLGGTMGFRNLGSTGVPLTTRGQHEGAERDSADHSMWSAPERGIPLTTQCGQHEGADGIPLTTQCGQREGAERDSADHSMWSAGASPSVAARQLPLGGSDFRPPLAERGERGSRGHLELRERGESYSERS